MTTPFKWIGLLSLGFLLMPIWALGRSMATPVQSDAPVPLTKKVNTKGCVQQGTSCLILDAEDGTIYAATFGDQKIPPVGSRIRFKGIAYPDRVSICGQGMVLKVKSWKLLGKNCPN